MLAAMLSASGIAAATAPAAPAWQPKFAVSSLLLWQMDVREACRTIASLGYDAVDLWAAFQHCTHLDEAKTRFSSKGGLNAMLAPAKLQLAAATVFWPGVEPFAKFLGDAGGAVVVRNSEFDTPGTLTSKMKTFLESVKPDLELAERHNLRVAIENHSGPMLLNRLDAMKAFVDLNQSARLGIALAPFHVQKNEQNVEEAIRVCGRQLFFFYALQLDEGTGFGQMPGHGPVDFAPWLAALSAIGYEGYVNVFMHGDRDPEQMQAAMVKSLAYLRGSTPK